MRHGVERDQQIGLSARVLERVRAARWKHKANNFTLGDHDVLSSSPIAEAHQRRAALRGDFGAQLVEVIAANPAGLRHDDVAVLLNGKLRG